MLGRLLSSVSLLLIIQGLNKLRLLKNMPICLSFCSMVVLLTCASPPRRSIRLLWLKCWARTWTPSSLTQRRRAEIVFNTSRSREESPRPSFLSTTWRWILEICRNPAALSLYLFFPCQFNALLQPAIWKRLNDNFKAIFKTCPNVLFPSYQRWNLQMRSWESFEEPNWWLMWSAMSLHTSRKPCSMPVATPWSVTT